MRIAVTGATGNIGVRLVERLLGEAGVEQVVGLARRPPAEETRPRVRWVSLDLGGDDAPAVLTRELAGVDVVVHLAWLIQPSHRPGLMRRANVTGSSHLLRAVEQAGVPALVHASSLGAYSPGPKRPVDESWATGGVPGSLYSAHKVEVERLLDTFQAGHPGVRVVRIRPTVVAQQEAAAEQARYFLGPLVPRALVRRSLLPVLPVPDGLTIQLVHAADIADLFARAALEPSARGPTTARPSRRSTRRHWPARWVPGGSGCRRRPCGPWWNSAGGPICSPPTGAGSSSLSGARCWTAAEPARSWAGRRRMPARRCSWRRWRASRKGPAPPPPSCELRSGRCAGSPTDCAAGPDHDPPARETSRLTAREYFLR